jgi:hypothetical protein
VKCIEAFRPTLIRQLACLAATSLQSAALVFEFDFSVKKCLAKGSDLRVEKELL